jgi:hypothetical protein
MVTDQLKDPEAAKLLSKQFLDLFIAWIDGGWDENETAVKAELTTLVEAFTVLDYHLADILTVFYRQVISQDIPKFLVAWNFYSTQKCELKATEEPLHAVMQFRERFCPCLNWTNLKVMREIEFVVNSPKEDSSIITNVGLKLNLDNAIFSILKDEMAVKTPEDIDFTIIPIQEDNGFIVKFFHAAHYLLLLTIVEVCNPKESPLQLQYQK